MMKTSSCKDDQLEHLEKLLTALRNKTIKIKFKIYLLSLEKQLRKLAWIQHKRIRVNKRKTSIWIKHTASTKKNCLKRHKKYFRSLSYEDWMIYSCQKNSSKNILWRYFFSFSFNGCWWPIYDVLLRSLLSAHKLMIKHFSRYIFAAPNKSKWTKFKLEQQILKWSKLQGTHESSKKLYEILNRFFIAEIKLNKTCRNICFRS